MVCGYELSQGLHVAARLDVGDRLAGRRSLISRAARSVTTS
jgi:hypothetical protein